MVTMTPLVKRLICAVAGHQSVRTITGVKLDAVSVVGDVASTITGERYDCTRCGRTLPTG